MSSKPSCDANRVQSLFDFGAGGAGSVSGRRKSLMIAWYPFGINECSSGWMKKILITVEEWMVLVMKILDGAPKLHRLAVDRGMLVQP